MKQIDYKLTIYLSFILLVSSFSSMAYDFNTKQNITLTNSCSIKVHPLNLSLTCDFP